MTSSQLIAYYLGVAIAVVIVFVILKAICLLFLERKRKKIYLQANPTATLQEIDEDFQQYFRKFKRRLYIILAIISVLIYIIISK